MRHSLLFAFVISSGCGSDSGSSVPAPFDPSHPYNPDVTAAELQTAISNDFYPQPVGARWVYQATTPDGVERDEVTVQAETYTVNGVAARVVKDTVYENDAMTEDTDDWYAQDADGNVWYLGEDTAEYDAGVVVSTAGSWTWGMNGALPGIVMLGAPEVGAKYRQEYLQGEAEDWAEVVALSEAVTVPAGSFTGCLKTHDKSAIDPDVDEFKYYCPGIGTVMEEEGDLRVELIEYSGL